MIELTRRHFLRGAGLVLAAPAIVRAASLMPVRVLPVNIPIVNATLFHPSFGTKGLAIDGRPCRAGDLVAGREYSLKFMTEAWRL